MSQSYARSMNEWGVCTMESLEEKARLGEMRIYTKET